jgi:uncharacterized protein YhaN
MGVSINSISVKDLGPIKSFSADFGIFNLIYSKNERGKTFFTEFIIRSLFRNTNRWSYIRTGGKGKVTINGLNDKKIIEFTPSSREKLEDYWEKSEKGLPLSMSKLMVVKGGEAGIENGIGVSKFLIKELLSGINILDKIDRDTNISKTIKKAEINNNNIAIDNIGEGKTYNNIKNELSDIEKLFEEIESGYTQGILKTYKIKEKNLQDNLTLLNQAKKNLAYSISERIKKLNVKLSEIPDSELNNIETEILIYRNDKEHYRQLKKDFKDAFDNSKDFSWLESAMYQYKDLLSKIINKPGKFLPSICGLSASLGTIASVILIFLYQKISSSIIPICLGFIFICFLVLAIFSFIYFKKLNNYLKQAGKNEELNRIREEFKKRTGENLTDISSLESNLNKQREYNSRLLAIENQINPLKKALEERYFTINHKIKNIYNKEITEDEWETIINELKQNNVKIKNNIESEKEDLNKLQVSEEDYVPDEVGITYSREEFEKIEKELDEIREEIKKREDSIQSLKQKICYKTRDDLSISWEELIDNLQREKEKTINELKEISATIIAGSTIHKVIFRLRKEEDEKIREGLQSETVTTPLKDITRRYNNLYLDDDNLIVSDPYDSFNVKDLSTGAVEQVMLALRIGFTSKLLKKDFMFLILDDAFQHSDWDKREIIIEKLAEIAEKGWQIIYLTMDNHIKSLFDKAGEKFGTGKYKTFEL